MFTFFSCKKKYADKNLVEKIKAMVASDQKNRLLITNMRDKMGTSSNFKLKWDSIMKIQEKIDEYNTKELIRITKEHGFPNTNFLKEPIPAWLIFQHTPDKYKEEVKKILETERNKMRIPLIEYEMIIWHLNGRKGIPIHIKDKDVIINDSRKRN